MDLIASKDGESLADATAEGLDYEVGSGSMLDGLDDAVTGLSAGESATFTSTLVGGPLKGEVADIEVRVTKVAQQELPELDDEFAQLASEFDTIDGVAGRLGGPARATWRGWSRRQRPGTRCSRSCCPRSRSTYPRTWSRPTSRPASSELESSLRNAQLTLEEYLADGDQTPEEFWAELAERTATALRAQLVLDKLAEEREITVDQNDLTQHIIRKAQQENTAPQQIADHLQEHPHHIDEYMTEIRRGKALGVLVEAAEITDSAGEPVDLDQLRPDGSSATDEPVDDENISGEVELIRRRFVGRGRSRARL